MGGGGVHFLRICSLNENAAIVSFPHKMACYVVKVVLKRVRYQSREKL